MHFRSTKMVLQQDLGRTLAETGKTALFITHDLVEAIALSDRILVMSQRPGRIIEEIVVEIPGLENPMARRKHLGGGAAGTGISRVENGRPLMNGRDDRLVGILLDRKSTRLNSSH